MGDQKSMINLNQFEATFWEKHYTYGQWSKIWNIMTVRWRMQMWQSWRKQLAMSLNQTNVTNLTMHLLSQAIWGHIWKYTVEKSQTSAANVTLPLLGQMIWRGFWKRTVEKRQTNAINITVHLFGLEKKIFLAWWFEETFHNAQWRKVKQMQPV